MKRPLSEELRPHDLSLFFGQEHLLGQKGLISSLLQKDQPLSLLLWGPPGCGKTTLAKIYIQSFKAQTFFLHPASHGISDLKKWVQEIQNMPLLYKKNILFIDEIHRFNKAQQDALLPFIEEGLFSLIGATTENPSFHLNQALLSRIRVLSLKPLETKDLERILENALTKTKLSLSDEAKKLLIQESKGDARHLLNSLENLLSLFSQNTLDVETISPLLSGKAAFYDRSGDGHYGLISAFHKALRGSDPDASLYWLARMLKAGEDPEFIARRLLRVSIEDIGLAEPTAQTIALEAWQTFERLGTPEGELALAKATLFLALAPKSNAVYKAFEKANELAEKTSHLPPPQTILNAPTALMKTMGYGKGYIYDHDTKEGFSGQNYFPDGMQRPCLYEPQERGTEREMKKRKDYFSKLRKEKGDLFSHTHVDLKSL